jgi:pimeloyl-ACP methyl ester carboxylesterase
MIITGGAGLKKPQTEEQKKRAGQYQTLKKGAAFLKGMKIFGSLPDKLANVLRKRYGSRDYNALDEEMRKTFVKIVSQDLRPLLPVISVSTLLVWGDQDTETPLWMGQTMAKEIPDAGLAILEGGSHYAYLEQWQRFVRIALHFFTED